MAGHKQPGPRPQCPRPEHAGSNIRRYGYRGPEHHRRPRWKCVPANGDKPHEFSELLPRQTTHEGFCIECERGYAHNEGPQSARYYGFTIREIAAALMRIGQGASYRDAAGFARDRGHRWPANKKGVIRLSRHGQLVADWVEVFAPVVYEPHRDFDWPAEGSLLLDALPFRLNSGIAGGRDAFTVLAAMGWDPQARRMRLYKLHAFPARKGGEREEWEVFLRSLGGTPKRIVCDQGQEMVKAISTVWPEVPVHYCEYHLRQRCYQHAKTTGFKAGDPVYDLIERAFDNPASWAKLSAAWNKTKNKVLRSHIRRTTPRVIRQIEGRARFSTTKDPFTTGALDEDLRWLRSQLNPRASLFTNQERLDRALLLMLLERNKQSNEAAYSRSIHEWLMSNKGRPVATRRAIVDEAEHRSLRR